MLILELHVALSDLQLEDRLDIVDISDGAKVLIVHLLLYLLDVILCSCEVFLLGSVHFARLHFELVDNALEGEEEFFFCFYVSALELKDCLPEFDESLPVFCLFVDELYYPGEDIVLGPFSSNPFLEQLLDRLKDLVQAFLCREVQLNCLALPSLFCI